MVTISAGSGLDALSESWSNPTSQTLPLVPGTFSPDLDRTWRIGATAHRIISLAESNGSRVRDLR